MRRGNIGSAFKSIEALPPWMDSQKSFLKLQLVERVAPGHELVKLLRSEIGAKDVTHPQARLRLARIALRANEENVAYEMLGPAISGLVVQEDLEDALDIAEEISADSLIDETRSRLEALFPDSIHLFEDRLTQLVNTRDYSAILALLDAKPPLEPELRFVYQTLALALQSGGIPEYATALTAIDRTAPSRANWARIVCAHDALARREFTTAIRLCLPTEERPLTSGTLRLLLSATRRLLLQRKTDGTLAVTGEQLSEPVLALIRYLSTHPKDGATRLSLVSLLSAETAGSLGLAVLIAATLNLQGAIIPDPGSLKQSETAQTDDDLELTPFLESAMEWVARESPLHMELARLPAALLTAPPDKLFSKLKQLVSFDQDLRDPISEGTFEKLVFIAVLVAAHTRDPNQDLELLRYASARLISANRLQRARDFAEHGLAIAGGPPERRRLAWIAYADTYLRAHNTIESVLGMACAFAVDASIDFEQMWHETYLLIRILRTLHFTDHARAALGRLRRVTGHLEPRGSYDQRVTTLELSIRVLEVTRVARHDSLELRKITEDAEKHCSDLLLEEEEIAPAATLLSHCIYLSRFVGQDPSQTAISTLKRALPKVSPPLASLIHALTSPESGPSQLLELARSIEPASNAEDVAFDLRDTAVAARRFLDAKAPSDDAVSTIFAIELLTDHAIRGSPTGMESPLTALETTAKHATEISAAGLRVVFLGIGESGRLVRVNVEGGRIEEPVREEEKIFSGRKLEEWSKRYPYGYAGVKDPMNLFYITTDGLGLTLSPSTPTILVMDTSLQRLPPNLVRSGDEFLGRTTPIASVPSMAWLWAARRSLPAAGRLMKAWISTETAEGKNPALVMVAERLRDCLGEHRINLDTSAHLPNDLRDAQLVVIAAHGGVLPEGRYIQRLSDDANLALYPAALASAVSGSSIVVLFVCSGGRVDPHPGGQTTVGLVKELFNEGCSTVIASPWPLNVAVPPHWLPIFLQEWTSGKTPIEATYLANKNVEKRLGDAPSECLAMNVFGDPLRKKS